MLQLSVKDYVGQQDKEAEEDPKIIKREVEDKTKDKNTDDCTLHVLRYDADYKHNVFRDFTLW